MKDLNIAFFGTSDRSIPILDSLKQNFNIVLCVTKNDVLTGRHQEIKPTAVKTWAKNNNVEICTISSLKSSDLDKVFEQLNTSNPDYILVADFSFIIPDTLIEKYPNKIINVHFSLLPKYRGASPVQFAILNGEDMSGITFHLVARKMDQGDIIHQIGYKMAMNETSGSLYDTLFELASRELPDVLEKYNNGTYKLRPQNENEATYTLSPTNNKSTFIYKEDAQIDWKMSPESIKRAVRAFNPWPIAWTYLEELEKNKKLMDQKITLKQSVNKKLKIRVFQAHIENALLVLDKVQIEGKSILDRKEFENGFIEKNDKK